MKRLALDPYHLFRFRGKHYLFDIASSAVMRLDGPAYDALMLRRTGAPSQAITDDLAASYGVDAAASVVKELRWLEHQGLLSGPVAAHDGHEDEAHIQRLIGMATNKIELYLAEACNLRCRYCYVNENRALNNGLMPWEVARQAIDYAFRRAGRADTVNITFFGGEPLLNKPVLRQAIQYSQELGRVQGKRVTYSMTTNATLLDDEIIGYIKRYNFGLMVSLDGPKEIQDAMRPLANGQGSFDLATANIKRLMAQRRSVTVRCTLSNRCLDRPAIVDFLEGFGFTRVAMSRCLGTAEHLGPYDIGPKENATLRAQDDFFIDRLIAQLARGERIRFNPWAAAVRNIHDKENRRMRCGVGRGCTTVGIDGRLYPCHRYVGMQAYVLGDIRTGIDRGRFADYLRGYFKTRQKCETCWALNLCGGYCPWYVSGEDGIFHAPRAEWCQDVLVWYEQGIWLYDTLRSRFPDYFRQLVGEDGASEPLLR